MTITLFLFWTKLAANINKKCNTKKYSISQFRHLEPKPSDITRKIRGRAVCWLMCSRLRKLSCNRIQHTKIWRPSTRNVGTKKNAQIHNVCALYLLKLCTVYLPALLQIYGVLFAHAYQQLKLCRYSNRSKKVWEIRKNDGWYWFSFRKPLEISSATSAQTKKKLMNDRTGSEGRRM